MAYTETYKVHFTNDQTQDVLATIYKKDGPVVSPVPEYMCASFELSDKSDGQTKYESTIITRELIMSIWTEDGDAITWETFITAEHDEWKIIVEVDAQTYFEGFITPDEGNALFQDKPYEVVIKATNGLSLLKGTELVDVDGNTFSGDHTLIKYIAGALNQSGLQFPIRVRCAYFNKQMNDKADGLNYDMFAQAKLNYRTFQENPTKFVSCYDALQFILDKFCRLEYWNGYWQIKCIGELQYTPLNDYYVDYDYRGDLPNGAIETENYAQVGKAVDIYPINEDQQVYSRFAIKSAKTIYNYETWPEIPTNNKFERGTQFDTGPQNDFQDMDGDGDTSEIIGTYKKYTIDNWTQGRINANDFPHPAMTAISEKFYRLSIYNTFGIEIERSIACETPNTVAGTQFWLRSEGMPVNFGDRVNVSFQKRFDNGGVTGAAGAALYIVSNDNSRAVTLSTSETIRGLKWVECLDPAFGMFGWLLMKYSAGQDSSQWNSVDVKSPVIPFDGTMYMVLACEYDPGTMGARQYWKDVTIEYIPFVAGGYVQVKGDYWIRAQNKVFPDVAADEVKISDSLKKIFKGALLVGSDLAEPTWYRYGVTIPPFSFPEVRAFKELLNIARFNHSYRRMYAIEGTFNGLNYSPQNNQLQKYPIGFHKRYRLVDISPNRDFVLVPPLKMDLIKGWTTMNLVEVINTANSEDGTQDGDTGSFNYIFNNNG
jgi:hypothetical protein